MIGDAFRKGDVVYVIDPTSKEPDWQASGDVPAMGYRSPDRNVAIPTRGRIIATLEVVHASKKVKLSDGSYWTANGIRRSVGAPWLRLVKKEW